MQLDNGVFLDIDTVDSGDLDRRRLAALLPAWDWYGASKPAEIGLRIGQADVVLSNTCVLDRAILSSARQLKLVALVATGTDRIDLQAAAEFGITVCNIRDYCSDSVSQHVITLMLNLLTGQPWYWHSVRQGEWGDSRQFRHGCQPIRQARGLVFGVIGNGVLGRATAGLARGIGMKVMVAERKGRNPRPGRVAFEELIRNADVLSIHCPLTEETRNMIGLAELQAMKSDAILINTARGGIVNERELADSLRNRVIAGAGVDALSEEPPSPDHPLMADDIPGLIITPHNAWGSREARQAALDQLAEIIESFSAGAPINVVA